MVKRQLNNDELVVANKVLIKRKEEVEWIEYQILYHDLMLSTGLEMNYKKTVSDFKNKKRDFEEQLGMNNESIKILQKQIREGVDVKEESTEGGKK